ncbi:MAG: PqqD family protein [Clostridia bacterium]|nr:PqqD family protein [Clostridia bacterium]
MQIKKEFVLREIAGDFVLVPVGKTGNEFKGLFPISETGAFIWNLLPEADSQDYIIEKLLSEYEVDRETVSADVSEFLSNLREYGIID